MAGITIGIIVAAVVAIAAFLLKRRRDSATGSQTSTSQLGNSESGASLLVARQPSPAPAGAQAAAAPAASSVPGTVERVSCNYEGAVHGAMPPFGTLSWTGTAIVFEAKSRIVAKAGTLGDDDSSTLQSLGAVEMGRYRFEIEKATIQRVDFSLNTAVLHADDAVYTVEALGGGGPKLKAWLVDKGLDC